MVFNKVKDYQLNKFKYIELSPWVAGAFDREVFAEDLHPFVSLRGLL